MYKTFLFAFFSAITLSQCASPEQKGEITIIENFSSEYVASRNIEIYTPPNYSLKSVYPVIYMHDGQNVFTPENTFAGIDWGVDEAIDSLVNQGAIAPVIVVASWNTPLRWNEYMPNVVTKHEVKTLPFGPANNLVDSVDIISDNYLKFVVEELKPYIDSTYSTKSDVKNTYIMGSSMGGLISAYAMMQYPEVFSKAGCISTHWTAFGGRFIDTLAKYLPDPATHAIYFDHGTVTLDSLYESYQIRVDSIMLLNDYTKNKNWMTLKFEGAEHNEASWRERIHIPLEFLVGKK